ncbi:MAG: trypsin-like peptidase domain-containing protein [Spirochaetota bacterium]
MNKGMLTCALLLTVFLCPGYAQPQAPQFSDAAKIAKPSVVYISVYVSDNQDGKRNYIKTGYGSGTIISSEGYILTNFHVVNKGNYYQVVLYDGTECDIEKMPGGEYYAADDGTDLAVLKIKNPERYNLTPARFGNSDSLQEGEWVIAIGNPYGLRHSVTCGIVSSVGRSDVGFAEIEDFIQTDVPINPGNSGGPLVNVRGEVVGVNTAIRTVSGGFQGISFAIPSDLSRKVFSELLSYGRVRRGWLGMLVKEERRPSESDIKDLRIVSVMKKSPSADAGILEGDILRQIDGAGIASQGKLMRIVKNKPVGSQLKIVVSRSGKLKEFTITLREKETYKKLSQAMAKLLDSYGIELEEDATTGGLIVSYLSPLRLSAHGNQLSEGDILLKVNGARMKSLDDFARIYAKWDYSVTKATILRNGRIYVIDFENAD